jgi:hypothetical protein
MRAWPFASLQCVEAEMETSAPAPPCMADWADPPITLAPTNAADSSKVFNIGTPWLPPDKRQRSGDLPGAIYFAAAEGLFAF